MSHAPAPAEPLGPAPPSGAHIRERGAKRRPGAAEDGR